MTDLFVGTWKLNPERCEFDPNHRPTSGTLVFERDAQGHYLMKAEGTNAKGQKVAERPQTFILDGEPHPVPDFPGLSARATQPNPHELHAQVQTGGRFDCRRGHLRRLGRREVDDRHRGGFRYAAATIRNADRVGAWLAKCWTGQVGHLQHGRGGPRFSLSYDSCRRISTGPVREIVSALGAGGMGRSIRHVTRHCIATLR